MEYEEKALKAIKEADAKALLAASAFQIGKFQEYLETEYERINNELRQQYDTIYQQIYGRKSPG